MRGECTTMKDCFDPVFEVMPHESRVALRRRLVAAVRSDAPVVRARRLARRAFALVTALTLTSGGVAYAAASAVPGDPLYAVKIAAEEAAIAAAPRAVRLAFIERSALERADEIAKLAAEGASEPNVRSAVGRFEAAATRAIRETPASAQADERLLERVDRVPEPAKARARKALDKARKAGRGAGESKSPGRGSRSTGGAAGGRGPSAEKGGRGGGGK